VWLSWGEKRAANRMGGAAGLCEVRGWEFVSVWQRAGEEEMVEGWRFRSAVMGEEKIKSLGGRRRLLLFLS
jgi:hypothetical protein